MILGAALAAVTAFAVGGLIALWGPVDRPRERGQHTHPTPTTGGLAVIAGTCVAVLVFAGSANAPSELRLVAGLLGCAGILGLFGAVDDVIDIGAKVKLVVQTAVALAFALLVAKVQTLPIAPGLTLALPDALGVIGTVLWLVVVVNTINFMDGANGLALGVQGILLFTLSLVAGGSPLLAFALLAAAIANLGFLPWNHPGGRVFQGDAGALFSAFLFGGGAVILAQGYTPAVSPYPAVFAILPLLIDVLLTLFVRARDKKPLLSAHKEHLYQLWLAETGKPHGALAWRVWALVITTTAAGMVVETFARAWALPLLLSLAMAMSWAWFRLRTLLTTPG